MNTPKFHTLISLTGKGVKTITDIRVSDFDFNNEQDFEALIKWLYKTKASITAAYSEPAGLDHLDNNGYQ